MQRKWLLEILECELVCHANWLAFLPNLEAGHYNEPRALVTIVDHLA